MNRQDIIHFASKAIQEINADNQQDAKKALNNALDAFNY